MPVAVTIGGSDSSGGAGIQADLATFAVLGVFGASVLTRVTAQNTRGVRDVCALPPDFVAAQLAAVYEDLDVRAVKTGSLSSAATIAVVARVLREHRTASVVVDPVFVAKSGTRLLDDAALGALVSDLLPLATVITPNRQEAGLLVGRPVRSLDEATVAARELLAMMSGSRQAAGSTDGSDRPAYEPMVVVTSASSEKNHIVDLVCTPNGVEKLRGVRIEHAPTHGAGCVFSAAIAAGLAHGVPALEAVRAAREVVTRAIRSGIAHEPGRGPVSPGLGLGRRPGVGVTHKECIGER
ncbi:MAG: bifunctional hydroxymethylpyrimidine kinase/phosphomethylpyrimidine kinase [Chloroflexi bacterium]|nr:bifunctional hydroxymethylpyrimidine kinase/phosphomethylpyrimidine kinase [Chloroflexota bacterium]